METIAFMLGAAAAAFGLSAFIIQVNIINSYRKQNEELLDNYNALKYSSNEMVENLNKATEKERTVRRIIKDNTLLDVEKYKKISKLFVIDFYKQNNK